jgi:hypothetical protein
VLWGLACFAALIVVLTAGESCRKTIARGEQCSGFNEFVNTNGTVAGLGILVVGAFGLWLIPRLNSRPCPRCGERVPNGTLHCPACDYDFVERQ